MNIFTNMSVEVCRIQLSSLRQLMESKCRSKASQWSSFQTIPQDLIATEKKQHGLYNMNLNWDARSEQYCRPHRPSLLSRECYSCMFQSFECRLIYIRLTFQYILYDRKVSIMQLETTSYMPVKCYKSPPEDILFNYACCVQLSGI